MSADESIFDDPQIRRRLDAARGYCELSLPKLAWEEIEPLVGEFEDVREVIEVELMVVMQLHDWPRALDIAQRLREHHPQHPAGWLQTAYCLHELRRTQEALEVLTSSPRALRKEPLFHYNCACYFAVLQQPREALAALRRAIELAPDFRAHALRDPDLADLRSQL